MNRVWLEIERDADEAINHERAEKLTNLLSKLGSTKEVWFNETAKHYCIVTDEAGSFVELTDNGHWFNLDGLNDRN
jgi:hypothetical protein|tara:strand:+ start:1070 stop:1297 length:228 start_codon:yes stop_codon:yes gene_type:complete